MGEHVGHNHFAVRDLTVQRRGSFARFIREIREAVIAIRAFFAQTRDDYARFNYLGEWHSHPMFTTQPSPTDHETMVEIACDPKVGANFVVLLIFRLGQHGALEGSAHTYLPDGRIWLSQLDMEKTA